MSSTPNGEGLSLMQHPRSLEIGAELVMDWTVLSLVVLPFFKSLVEFMHFQIPFITLEYICKLKTSSVVFHSSGI